MCGGEEAFEISDKLFCYEVSININAHNFVPFTLC